MSPAEALRLAVVRHQNRTGTGVLIEIEPLPETMSHELKACLYRVVQELLNNATRHAQAKGQRVSARADGSDVVVTVSDEGTGMLEALAGDDRPRLGLLGIRLRIDGFGGELDIQTMVGSGTKIVVTVPLENGRMH